MIKTLNCVSLRIKDHQNHTHDRRRVFKSIDGKITIYLSLFICFVRGDDGIKSGIGTFDPYPKISETRVFKYIYIYCIKILFVHSWRLQCISLKIGTSN